jgi:hypothetical protein
VRRRVGTYALLVGVVCATGVMGRTNAIGATGAADPIPKRAIRLSWDQCDPLVAHKDFAGPGPYELVISAAHWGGRYNAHQVELQISPAAEKTYPDAWRFDDGVGACQPAGRMTISNQALAKSCPALQGGRPLHMGGLVFARADGPANTGRLILANAFDTFESDPKTRYTLWRVRFDHAGSVAGKGADSDSTCGAADAPLCIRIVKAQYVNEKNETFEDLTIENGVVTWQKVGGKPLACAESAAPRARTAPGDPKSLEETKSLGKPDASPR